MGFNRDDRGGGGRGFGRRNFGGGGFGGGRDFNRGGFGSRGGDRPMFKAICSNCGKECEVPFRPTGAKPVFCSECFEKRSREAGHDNFRDRGERSQAPQYGQEFSALNAKLDKILAMLAPSAPVETPQVEKAVEKPTKEKPKKEVEKTKNKKPAIKK